MILWRLGLEEYKKKLTSAGNCLPGIAGTPVIKSWVQNGRSTTDLWQEGILSAWSLSKWIGRRTTGIWLIESMWPELWRTWKHDTLQVSKFSLGNFLSNNKEDLNVGVEKCEDRNAYRGSDVVALPHSAHDVRSEISRRKVRNEFFDESAEDVANSIDIAADSRYKAS